MEINDFPQVKRLRDALIELVFCVELRGENSLNYSVEREMTALQEARRALGPISTWFKGQDVKQTLSDYFKCLRCFDLKYIDTPTITTISEIPGRRTEEGIRIPCPACEDG